MTGGNPQGVICLWQENNRRGATKLQSYCLDVCASQKWAFNFQQIINRKATNSSQTTSAFLKMKEKKKSLHAFTKRRSGSLRQTNIKEVMTEMFKNHIRLPVVSRMPMWLKADGRAANTGAWSSICKQESQTSTGRLLAPNHSQTPTIIISILSESSSY